MCRGVQFFDLRAYLVPGEFGGCPGRMNWGIAFAGPETRSRSGVMDPLFHAVVRWLNEKSQNQALDRRQPGLSLNKGRTGTVKHNVTTTLFATMSIVDGTVIGRNVHRDRHQEFVRLLNGIEDKGSAAKILTTMPPASITRCFNGSRGIPRFVSTSRRPRALGSTPSRVLTALTKRRLRRGVFKSGGDQPLSRRSQPASQAPHLDR
jgi:hypothetical protein